MSSAFSNNPSLGLLHWEVPGNSGHERNTILGVPQKFREQRAKVERTKKRLYNAEHELHCCEIGYKEEGIHFSDKVGERLDRSISHWTSLLRKQSLALLKLHDRMLSEGKAVDPAFNRSEIEKHTID